MKTALCIGINDYPGSGQDLAGCVPDAHDWGRQLAARDFAVEYCLDRNARRARLLVRLAGLVAATQADDVLVITYSGHGSYQPDADGDERDRRDEGWCPWDFATEGLLLDDTLARVLGKAHSLARVIVISDSCHSGTMARQTREQWRRRFVPLPASARRFVPASNGDERPAGVTPVWLSACQDHETAADAFFGVHANGAFSRHALDALCELPRHATYADWWRRIQLRLPSRQFPQRPNLVATQQQLHWEVFA